MIDECTEVWPDKYDYRSILGKCYLFSKASAKWNDAQLECQKHPGNYDLVAIDSKDLNDALKDHPDRNYIGGFEGTWIGLHDMYTEGKIQWVNGQDIDYGKTWNIPPWGVGQPDVSYGT